MKLKTILTMIIISAVAVFTACTSSDDEGDSLKSGTISGTAIFTTSSGSNTSANVKLAAVYYPEFESLSEEGAKIISNVVDLGNAPNAEVPFSLDIDFESASSPEIGSGIVLKMWVDSNNDDIMDESEKDTSPEPDAGCPVFGSSIFCYIMYLDSWEISTSTTDSVPFEDATKSGAKIITSGDIE